MFALRLSSSLPFDVCCQLAVVKMEGQRLVDEAEGMKKTKRQQNFSEKEISVLVDEAQKNILLIQSKFSSTVTNTKKDALWREITETVNAMNKGVMRTKKEVKRKWQDLCCDTRKKEAYRKREETRTGGGEAPKPLTEVQEKVLTMISPIVIDGISGGAESCVANKLKQRYGSGEMIRGQCTKCGYEEELFSSGVHESDTGCLRVYSEDDKFVCPNCPKQGDTPEPAAENIGQSFVIDDMDLPSTSASTSLPVSDEQLLQNQSIMVINTANKAKQAKRKHEQMNGSTEELLEIEREKLKLKKQKHEMLKVMINLKEKMLEIEMEKVSLLKNLIGRQGFTAAW